MKKSIGMGRNRAILWLLLTIAAIVLGALYVDSRGEFEILTNSWMASVVHGSPFRYSPFGLHVMVDGTAGWPLRSLLIAGLLAALLLHAEKPGTNGSKHAGLGYVFGVSLLLTAVDPWVFILAWTIPIAVAVAIALSVVVIGQALYRITLWKQEKSLCWYRGWSGSVTFFFCLLAVLSLNGFFFSGR